MRELCDQSLPQIGSITSKWRREERTIRQRGRRKGGKTAQKPKAPLPCSILATCPAQPNLLDLIALPILGEQHKK